MFYLICMVFLNFPLWIGRIHIKLILISNFFWKIKTSAILGPHSHRAIGPGLRSSSWPLWQAMHAQGPHCPPTDQYAWSLGWSVQVYHLSHALLPTPLNLCRIKRKSNIYWTQISIKSLKTKDASRGLHVSIHPPSFTYLPETDRTEFVTSQPHPNLNNSSSGTKRKGYIWETLEAEEAGLGNMELRVRKETLNSGSWCWRPTLQDRDHKSTCSLFGNEGGDLMSLVGNVQW